jgi:hypothetical protein
MAERQALGIDTNEYARTGGTNIRKVKKHIKTGVYDFLILKAGGGTVRNPIFNEQREQAERIGAPYSTYHFPVPGQDMKAQARSYIDWVGTEQRVYIIDAEKPRGGPRPPNKRELRTILDEVERLTKKQPVLYTRVSLLREIDFVNQASQYRLWIAQYLYDPALSDFPEKDYVQYRYFQDFTRDHTRQHPPEVLKPDVEVLKDKVIMWQFTEHGDGRHYVYNRRTNDPVYPDGKLGADLNISLKGREEFMQLMFGGVPVITDIDEDEVEGEVEGEVRGRGRGRGRVRSLEPTYPGLTNQEMINIIFEAAIPFTDRPWVDWIVRAKLENLAIPAENRSKPYTGPKIEDLPRLSVEEKDAILAAKKTHTGRVRAEKGTYPSLTNQDIINLIFRAAAPFTVDPWADWIVRAKLEFLAEPEENRSKPYTGPKIEDLPNLTKREKRAILAEM